MNKKQTKFSPEVRERAVWLVREQRSKYPSMWASVETIAPMIGCTAQTLLDWVKRDEIDRGVRDGGQHRRAGAHHIRQTGQVKHFGDDFLQTQGAVEGRAGGLRPALDGNKVQVGGNAISCIDGVLAL